MKNRKKNEKQVLTIAHYSYMISEYAVDADKTSRVSTLTLWRLGLQAFIFRNKPQQRHETDWEKGRAEWEDLLFLSGGCRRQEEFGRIL